jgi:hypothetical protein
MIEKAMFIAISILTLILTGCHALTDDPDDNRNVKAACVFEGHLLCLGDRGAVRGWEVKTGAYSKEISNRFSRKGFRSLATDGEKLWAADDSALYQWSPKDKVWEKVADYNEDKEWLVQIVAVGGSPLLVFPSKVIDPIGKKTFQVPKIEFPFEGPPLRILALHGTDSMLWIGTGRGEWGGVLIGLNPKSGKWAEGDGGGYVTGITHSSADEVVVSWSMSHFGCHTNMQIHKLDATRKTEYPWLWDKYYQQIAYSPFDKTLYGIESDQLVTIKDGKPSNLAKLKGNLYVNEPDAIGSAPAVLGVIPCGPKTVAVVPKYGDPWLLRDKNLIRLPKP